MAIEILNVNEWVTAVERHQDIPVVIDLYEEGSQFETDDTLRIVIATLDLVKLDNLVGCCGDTSREVIKKNMTAKQFSNLSDLVKLMINSQHTTGNMLQFTYEGGDRRSVTVGDTNNFVEFGVTPIESGFASSCTWKNNQGQITFNTPTGLFKDFNYLCELGLKII